MSEETKLVVDGKLVSANEYPKKDFDPNHTEIYPQGLGSKLGQEEDVRPVDKDTINPSPSIPKEDTMRIKLEEEVA